VSFASNHVIARTSGYNNMEKIKKSREKHLAKKDKFFCRSIFHVSHDPIMGDEKKSQKLGEN
jgi:uncharacterized protein YaaN involved in tellurite resistance